MHVLALDLGTSSVKAAVLDQITGDPVGPVAKVEYAIRRPVADAAEVDAAELWAAIGAAARKALIGSPAPDAIGLSCLTPALVLLDAAGEVVAPVRIHQDRRARPVSRRVQRECLAEFLATAGNAPLPGGLSGVTYAQLAADLPDVPGRVRHYLHANSWAAWKLTGVMHFDPGNAGFTGLFNTVTDQQWSPRWCDYFGVKREWLPDVADGRDTVGTLTVAAAEDWGLSAGLPVKLGVPDTSSGMLAARLKPGDLLHSVGTTQVLAVVTPPAPSEHRLTRRLGAGSAFVAVAHNPVGGVALDWLYELCFRDVPEDDFFAHNVPEAAGMTTPVRLDPPFLGGDRHQIEPRLAAFGNLGLDTEREDLLAALLAAMRAGHRSALDAIGHAGGGGRVVLTGGGAAAVRAVLPEYADAEVEMLDEAALRGVARLFDAADPS